MSAPLKEKREILAKIAPMVKEERRGKATIEECL